MASVDVKQHGIEALFKAQEMCESRGGRPGLPVSNSPYSESRGGRPRLPVPDSPYGLCGPKATSEEDFDLNVPSTARVISGQTIQSQLLFFCNDQFQTQLVTKSQAKISVGDCSAHSIQ